MCQMIFELSQQAELNSLLLTPTLSLRSTIPDGSKVFDIAARGSLNELELMLYDGRASLIDCDPEGRSLLNVRIM